jgi:RNA polymerase sigma-70 factor (ECF subfamily)
VHRKSEIENPKSKIEMDLMENIFRERSARLVSALTRIFGLGRIDLAEDAIQDALVRAMRVWPVQGVPENPDAWLLAVARNRALDELRKEKRTAAEIGEIETRFGTETIYFTDELSEDVLRMMFACCHPQLSPDSRVALTLKTVGGFSVPEIAAAFLTNREAVAKMLTRAKETLRKNRVRLEIPVAGEIEARLGPVLKVLYLMFSEGYHATAGDQLVRADLCREAIRLERLLAGHPRTAGPKVRALLALMLFQAARFSGRYDADGEIVLLRDQDRTLWDRRMIIEALKHLRDSAEGDEVSDYHYEAEIASIHALAPDFESTDWLRIVRCYEALAERRPSPVVELNRTIADAEIRGAEAALAELETMKDDPKLTGFAPYHVALGEFRARSGKIPEARSSFDRALGLAHNPAVARLIERKIAALRDPS